MKYDFDDLYEGPRFQNRVRKRKIKLIITSIGAIGIVLVIGIFTIFTGDNEEVNGAIEKTDKVEQSTDNSKEIDNEPSEDSEMTNPYETDSQSNDSEIGNPNQAVSNIKTSKSTRDDESDLQGVSASEENLEPVGTEQEGEHVTNFTKDSQDWKEMTNAVSSATGLSPDNMIIWWMGNGGAPNKAISKISTKDKQIYYRVQLEWVDNNGWKPVQVEQLEENVETEKPTKTTTENTN